MRLDNSENVSTVERKVLNSHGHPFHYAVVRRAETLLREKKSNWILDGVEFPFETKGDVGHIDIVLTTPTRHTILVGECKRANPGQSVWCFGMSPYTWRDPTEGEVVFDLVQWGEGRGCMHMPSFNYAQGNGVAHLAHELKTGDGGGEVSPSRRQAPADAVTQVLRGASGLVNHFQTVSTSSGIVGPLMICCIVPVVFTTATLWITEADLGAADLPTGMLTAELNAKRVDWLWFNYNRSPALLPNIPSTLEDNARNDLTFALRNQYARSVAIVGTDGIDAFLQFHMEGWLW